MKPTKHAVIALVLIVASSNVVAADESPAADAKATQPPRILFGRFVDEAFLDEAGQASTSDFRRTFSEIIRKQQKIENVLPDPQTIDSNKDGIPDFAQLDPQTKAPLQINLVNRSGFTRASAQLKEDTRTHIPAGAETAVTDPRPEDSKVSTTLPDFLKWNIQDSDSPKADSAPELDGALDDVPSERSPTPSPLHLNISMEKLSPERRQFRISVNGIDSRDRDVTIWVSTDLKTWSKIDDSMIETGDDGDRRIVVPLNSKIQFFRVSAP